MPDSNLYVYMLNVRNHDACGFGGLQFGTLNTLHKQDLYLINYSGVDSKMFVLSDV